MPIINYSRTFQPESVYEPIKFEAGIVYRRGSFKDGMNFCKQVVRIGAKPVVGPLVAKQNRKMKGVPIADTSVKPSIGEVEILLADFGDLEIDKVSLKFGQTWQLNKPFASSVSPFVGSEFDVDYDIPIGRQIAQWWGEIICAAYVAAEDALVADGRWACKFSEINSTEAA